MKESHIFVLRDHGQDICDECQLQGDDDLEPWENFINGEMVSDSPLLPGFYPVLVKIRNRLKQRVLEAREAKNKKGTCIWVNPRFRSRVVQRWSLPYPWPAMFSPEKEE